MRKLRNAGPELLRASQLRRSRRHKVADEKAGPRLSGRNSVFQSRRGPKFHWPLCSYMRCREFTTGLGFEKDIDKLEHGMRPDQIIERTAAKMGCFSQENGTLLGGGVGLGDKSGWETSSGGGERRKHSVEVWGWAGAGGGPKEQISWKQILVQYKKERPTKAEAAGTLQGVYT